ncbi:hypothetical protein [Gracilibacillus thailandensis]|jgi:hypothetical protein|uniref:Uncharacterized protein n=1 Tax=Gracilibacillus thailandensis TaxID=563735 RepID=A0A6N7QXY6_9BACI|nr:hypothetical protein [Gracilibacillus thailandensis]MRI67023.1 hypothetical protein [Gracilibacillus thailandensis]
MKFIIGNDAYMFENTVDKVEEIYKITNDKLKDETVFFSHFIIDGKEIYNEHDQYLLNVLDSIEEVHAILHTSAQLIESAITSLTGYLERSQPELQQFINDLYNGVKQIGAPNTFLLLEGLEWVKDMIVKIDALKQRPEEWHLLVNQATELTEILAEMEEVFQHNDPIVYADMLQYDIIPLFQNLKNSCEQIEKKGL